MLHIFQESVKNMLKSNFESRPLKLGVLDLCKRRAESSASQALEDTINLAVVADRLGYVRYWVGEHHTEDTASAAPEVLIPVLASHTDNIKLGSGGVLLRYYSPLKVAETFLVLESLFPNRIDLGVCKGPGVTLPQTARALVNWNEAELTEESFEQKVQDLTHYLSQSRDPLPLDSKLTRARPWGVTPPPVWVLGSSPKSTNLALRLNTPYSISLFLNQDKNFGIPLVKAYQERFKATAENPQPYASIVVSVLCLDTDEAAHRRHAEYLATGLLPCTIVGSPATCTAQIRELAKAYNVEEVLIATWQADFSERVNLYSRISEICHSLDLVA
jgi:luciferase family oxidoreductase group 1